MLKFAETYEDLMKIENLGYEFSCNFFVLTAEKYIKLDLDEKAY